MACRCGRSEIGPFCFAPGCLPAAVPPAAVKRSPRCYLSGTPAGWLFGLWRKTWVVPEPVGYDEVLERVLHAGLQVEAPPRRAVRHANVSFPIVRDVPRMWPDEVDARPAVWPTCYVVRNLAVGEYRRVCLPVGYVVDVVRIP